MFKEVKATFKYPEYTITFLRQIAPCKAKKFDEWRSTKVQVTSNIKVCTRAKTWYGKSNTFAQAHEETLALSFLALFPFLLLTEMMAQLTDSFGTRNRWVEEELLQPALKAVHCTNCEHHLCILCCELQPLGLCYMAELGKGLQLFWNYRNLSNLSPERGT